ncbi:MAG: hypothetical protein HYY16_17175 [Planctomycetes bacterium]|nr:hypothetical protein [Planctomycetota bacterium]
MADPKSSPGLIPQPGADTKIVSGPAPKPAPDGKSSSVVDTRHRVVGYARQAESVIRIVADFEKERARQEYMARYKNLAAVESDPEFQIRLREIDREMERKKNDLQAVIKLITDHEQLLGQLAAQEKALEARDQKLRDRELRLKNAEAEVDRRAADVDKRAADALANAMKRGSEAIAAAEKEAAAKRSQAEALLKQTEQDARERIESIAQTSREVESLQAKLTEELKHIDEVLNKAKGELALRLKQVLQEARANLDQVGRDIGDLLQ